ncbi:hypothetical protein QO002_000111 [Pararhizobium capsulatum DSM 1112]|uniref:Uncharacterized protein n=1 Tax=Pararhizobium capsulatum DSM 1112 TaxID=1121113 RepID=A0ABU0BI88_9HYPH|nr:hypothetical protein [Pararhizobium capsulatum DSM 1112]
MHDASNPFIGILQGRDGFTPGRLARRTGSIDGLRVCPGKMETGFPEKTNENKRI